MFGLGLMLSFSGWTCSHFGWYMAALSFFHWSEFMSTAITNPRSLTLESYLLDHSKEYHMAAVASWLEFFIEWYFFPGLYIDIDNLYKYLHQDRDYLILALKFKLECKCDG